MPTGKVLLLVTPPGRASFRTRFLKLRALGLPKAWQATRLTSPHQSAHQPTPREGSSEPLASSQYLFGLLRFNLLQTGLSGPTTTTPGL